MLGPIDERKPCEHEIVSFQRVKVAPNRLSVQLRVIGSLNKRVYLNKEISPPVGKLNPVKLRFARQFDQIKGLINCTNFLNYTVIKFS